MGAELLAADMSLLDHLLTCFVLAVYTSGVVAVIVLSGYTVWRVFETLAGGCQ